MASFFMRPKAVRVSLLSFLAAALLSAPTDEVFANTPIAVPTECATAERVSWQYSFDAHEQELADVNLEDDSTTFSLLKDFEGTSIIIRVKDAKTGKSLGVIKTDTSNTSTAGEVYAYRLARLLGFSEIVAPTIPIEMHDGALRKLLQLLNSKRYTDANKERNRNAVIRQVERSLRHESAFTGAFKVWVPAFMFHAGLGKQESIGNQPIARHFLANSPQPESKDMKLSQNTRLYSPAGTHEGVVNLAQLAEDYSNMMLMDALMAQNDRYAGANVHFRSVDGSRTEKGKRNGVDFFDLGRVRLLSLDNGASMKGKTGGGILDIQGKRNRNTRIERFSKTSVDQLRLLARRAKGLGCEHAASDEELSSLFAFLGVTDRAMRERAIDYIQPVLDYIDGLEKQHGDKIYFQPIQPQ